MSRQCQITKKRHRPGMTYTIRGIAKKKKGIGLNKVGSAKRRFYASIRKKRLWDPEDKCFVTIKLCSHGLKIAEKQGIHAVVKRLRREGQKV